MMFRYTGLSPSLVYLSRYVLLHSTLTSSIGLLTDHESSFYAKLATPVSFKFHLWIAPQIKQH